MMSAHFQVASGPTASHLNSDSVTGIALHNLSTYVPVSIFPMHALDVLTCILQFETAMSGSCVLSAK